MKRVLITGAAGFIGRHALPYLLDKHYEVHAISSRPVAQETAGTIWHRADLLDAGQIAKLMAKIRPTHLMHFAWYTEPGAYWQDPRNFEWLEASIALLRLFGEHGGQRLVMAGTCAEYDWDHGFCIEDVTPLRPETPYGICKNVLQKTLQAYCESTGISGAWGRIFFLYGPGEHPARLVSSVINAIMKGETAKCTHGKQIRDFLHVSDVAAAFVELLDSEFQGPVNISSGQPVTIRELVNEIAECAGRPNLIQFGAIPSPVDDPPLLVGDSRRLQNVTNWRRTFSCREGIEHTVAAYRSMNT